MSLNYYHPPLSSYLSPLPCSVGFRWPYWWEGGHRGPGLYWITWCNGMQACPSCSISLDAVYVLPKGEKREFYFVFTQVLNDATMEDTNIVFFCVFFFVVGSQRWTRRRRKITNGRSFVHRLVHVNYTWFTCRFMNSSCTKILLLVFVWLFSDLRSSRATRTSRTGWSCSKSAFYWRSNDCPNRTSVLLSLKS